MTYNLFIKASVYKFDLKKNIKVQIKFLEDIKLISFFMIGLKYAIKIILNFITYFYILINILYGNSHKRI